MTERKQHATAVNYRISLGTDAFGGNRPALVASTLELFHKLGSGTRLKIRFLEAKSGRKSSLIFEHVPTLPSIAATPTIPRKQPMFCPMWARMRVDIFGSQVTFPSFWRPLAARLCLGAGPSFIKFLAFTLAKTPSFAQRFTTFFGGLPPTLLTAGHGQVVCSSRSTTTNTGGSDVLFSFPISSTSGAGMLGHVKSEWFCFPLGQLFRANRLPLHLGQKECPCSLANLLSC